jgi:hypothetical protein
MPRCGWSSNFFATTSSAGPYKLTVSRIDIYADVQGWVPELSDLHRFVGFGPYRRGFEERQVSYLTGSRLTGFMFGKDALVARIYDKTVEIRRRGLSHRPSCISTAASMRPWSAPSSGV